MRKPTSDRELDRIIEREKPGFRRISSRAQDTAAPRTAFDGSTPDIEVLHAKARVLGVVPAPASRNRPSGGKSGGASGTAASSTRRQRSAHHIVTVSHERQHEADPLTVRAVVISRRQGKIVGEQG